MRILHVVSVAAKDGSYGGPTRVALNQTAELLRIGHSVSLAATSEGLGVGDAEIDGVPSRLARRRAVPRTGYAGTFSVPLLLWLLRNMRGYNVIHIHLSRDLVTFPATVIALMVRVPVIIQCHGMVVRKDSRLIRMFDRVATAPLLARGRMVYCLNADEEAQIREIAPLATTSVLPNGVPDTDIVRDSTHEWPEVLFLARLHPRKRPDLFARAAVLLLRDGVNARFSIVGPDEGAATAVDQIVEEFADATGNPEAVLSREPATSASEVLERLARANVYVLPAEAEPFGMSVVEASSVGVPVIVMRDCGLADFVERVGCGVVVDNARPEALAAAIRVLLCDPALAAEMGQRGREGVRKEFSMSTIAAELADCYGSVAVTSSS
ncbi:glycosyltransferase [Gordonia sp. NPDC003425]